MTSSINYPANEYTDPGDVADWAQDHSISCLDSAFQRVRDTKLEIVRQWYSENLGLDLTTTSSWSAMNELPLIANSVRHAEGSSTEQLRKLRPELFSNPDFAELLAEWEKRGLKPEPKGVYAAMSGEDLFVTESHLGAFADAERTLFDEIIDYCEMHRHERFPRSI